MANTVNNSLNAIALQERIRELEAELNKVWEDLEKKERDQYLSELMYLENGESM